MIKKFKIFENTMGTFDKELHDHMSGNLPIKDSYKLIDSALEYFNGKIPYKLKYEGPVYRIMQFRTKEHYNEILKKGMIPIVTQKYWSCAKDLKSIENVKSFTSKHRYKYFITFKLNVTYDDVLFDLNKMYEYISGYISHIYSKENEVVVLTKNFPIISTSNIVDKGKIILE